MRAGGPEDEPGLLRSSIWGLILTPGAAGVVRPTRVLEERRGTGDRGATQHLTAYQEPPTPQRARHRVSSGRLT